MKYTKTVRASKNVRPARPVRASHSSLRRRAIKADVDFDDVYNKIHGFARDHAMLNYGAVESGTVTWADDGSGNWDTISRNITESSGMSISTESSIKHNMENILSSDEGKNASGNNFERAKKANKIYDEKVNSKISNATYKSNKANYDATKQNK